MPHQLEVEYPFIPWREPLKVTTFGDCATTHYACRICIGAHGLPGHDIPNLPTDPEVVRQHIKEVHG